MGVVLLPQHGKPGRQVVHQQAGAEVISRGQSGGQVKLLLNLLLLRLFALAKE
jgi:hypothetical protein